MSAPVAIPGTAPAPRVLGVVALVLALAAVLLGVVAAPIELLLQVRGGVPFAVVTLGFAVPTGVIALVALILGIVAVRRPRAAVAVPAAAVGIAAFLLAGQLVGAIVTAVASSVL